MTSPPWAEVIAIVSRRLAIAPISVPAGITSRPDTVSESLKGALGGGDDHAPGRRGLDRVGLAVLLDERAGVLELVGRLQGEGLDALEGSLGDPGQGAGRRHLQDAGHADVGHGVEAEVPAHRVGDLADDPVQRLGAVVDDLAVLVADQARTRVVGRDALGQPGEVADSRLHVLGVEGAGDAERHQPGLGGRLGGEGLELLERARGDDLAGAVVVGGGETVLLDRGEDLLADAAEDGGHAGRRLRSSLGHGLAALTDEDHRLLGADRASAGGGGDLTDAVAGDGADLREGVRGLREELQGRDQAGGDQQGLGDLGGADGLGIGIGAVVDQVEACDG
ncbi:hypothetical protein CIRG_10389 [Coccidioides immitis RMSCC 2394]|uniref:Uncharacterized protein n=1 Tax=Coccidioides immitis RMSCC 2394 TaxID=404692 RepID=A0A0J6Y1S4_COCIT|nr:hypothetical protein CIRG_10389 [Coccidioides immitis RMSCC 2394]